MEDLMKKILFIFLFSLTLLYGINYSIILKWDKFEGDCVGKLIGNINNKTDFVLGYKKENKLEKKIISSGENIFEIAQQKFIINSNKGYFTFWIYDKFVDQDINDTPCQLSKSKPIVEIFKNGDLIKTINLPQKKGLVAKVFSVDVNQNSIEIFNEFFQKSRIFTGKIVNAINNKPVKFASISFKNSINQIFKIKTGNTGKFLFNPEIGKYEVSVEKEGFINFTTDIFMNPDETPQEYHFALTPKTDKIRIVLTWNKTPFDLDAHLRGPNPDGGKFHIWYRHKKLIGGKDFLDLDDQNGWGPETITIYKPAKGKYSYFVHNYSNKENSKSKDLSFSNALVSVYKNQNLVKTFSVPVNKIGTVWHVFDISEIQNIISVNSIEFTANEKNIQ
jgi:hypothetical protein